MIDLNKQTIPEIIEELNYENGSNYKIAVLKKYKDCPQSELLQKVLKMTYDKVSYTYGVTLKNLEEVPRYMDMLDLEDQLHNLGLLTNRIKTGNAALELLHDTIYEGSEENAVIIKGIINRDLRINMGRSNVNKVFKNLIVKPPYMRCAIYGEKTAKKINFPALVQLKADGRFVAITVDGTDVTFNARSGEESNFPHLLPYFQNCSDGVYIGELLVHGEANRSLANGIINSDDNKDDVFVQLWDYVTLDEYSRGKDKKNKTEYLERFDDLQINIKETNNVQIIETYMVQNIQEALQYTSHWMNQGLEGAILKDYKNIFIDHTSPTQLKLKLAISAEMRVTGFIEGKKGTKREETFGSLMFQNDEGTVKGSTSGFTDKQLTEINNNREAWIGKVIEVEFNDLTKGRDNEYYALSHPRYIADRSNEKDETDTLEKCLEMKNMAMNLGSK